MNEQEKADFKNFIKKEMEDRNPKLLPRLDDIADAIFRVVKTKSEALAFLKGYLS